MWIEHDCVRAPDGSPPHQLHVKAWRYCNKKVQMSPSTAWINSGIQATKHKAVPGAAAQLLKPKLKNTLNYLIICSGRLWRYGTVSTWNTRLIGISVRIIRSHFYVWICIIAKKGVKDWRPYTFYGIKSIRYLYKKYTYNLNQLNSKWISI